MKRAFLCGPLLLLACEDPDRVNVERTELPEGEVLRYVTGGTHLVEAAGGDHAIALDTINQPGRLHPALSLAAYRRFDPDNVSGETDMEVHASTWWPMSTNGAAWRWTGAATQSPTEKYDRLFYPGTQYQVPQRSHWYYAESQLPLALRPPQHSHPAISAGPATAWEITRHGVYRSVHPDSWWGHCNGWASYQSSGEGSPTRNLWVKWQAGQIVECSGAQAGCVFFRAGDIEALFAEVYFSDRIGMAGRRCEQMEGSFDLDEYGRPEDPACLDLNPASFHVAVTGILGTGVPPRNQLGSTIRTRPAIVIDYNSDHEVWSFPLVAYELSVAEEITAEQAAGLVGSSGYVFNASATRFARVTGRFTMVSDSVGPATMLQLPQNRVVSPDEFELSYVLEMSGDGTIIGGEWIEDPSSWWSSRLVHPDFFWLTIAPNGWGEAADDTGGGDDNPYLSVTRLRLILRCANDPSTCDATP